MKKKGRPTKYNPGYCKELIEYFDVEPYKTRTKTIVTKKGDKIEVDEDYACDLPTLAGFAVKIGTHRETLLNWTKEHPEFFDAYKKAKECQHNILVTNGLRGLVQPAFAIFTAKNILGWRDKQEVEHAGKIENEITVRPIDLQERIKQLKGEVDE